MATYSVNKRLRSLGLVLGGGLLGVAACAAPRPPALSPQERAFVGVLQKPDDAAAYLSLARHLEQQNEYGRSYEYLRYVERYLIDQADRRHLARWLLTTAVRAGRYHDAIERCELLLSVRDEPEVQRLLAALYENIGDPSRAAREHERLLRTQPLPLEQVLESVRFFMRSGLPEGRPRAQELLRQALQAARGDEEAAQLRAQLRDLELATQLAKRR